MGISQNYGYLFGGPHNKDYSILGSILGPPYFGKLPYRGYSQIPYSNQEVELAVSPPASSAPPAASKEHVFSLLCASIWRGSYFG